MVQAEQITAMIDFLQCWPKLARGHLSRTTEGRSLAKKLWTQCAEILNSSSPDGRGPIKSPTEWRAFYNEYKFKLCKKVKNNESELNETGGGTPKNVRALTPLQERLYNILGGEIQEPPEEVPQIPITESLEYRSEVEEKTEETLGHRSEVEEKRKETLGYRSEVEEKTEDLIDVDAPPVRRRKRIRRARSTGPYPRSADRTGNVESQHQATLEAAQERLERIEKSNAEAMLEQARATSRLAAAIEVLGQKLSQPIVVRHIGLRKKKTTTQHSCSIIRLLRE